MTAAVVVVCRAGLAVVAVVADAASAVGIAVLISAYSH